MSARHSQINRKVHEISRAPKKAEAALTLKAILPKGRNVKILPIRA